MKTISFGKEIKNVDYNGHNYKVEEKEVNDHITDYFVTIDNYHLERFSINKKYYNHKDTIIDNEIKTLDVYIKKNFIQLGD